MKSMINKIDIFGKPLQLRLGKEINNSTLFGGILSLITYLLVCSTFFYKILQYFERTHANVNFRLGQSSTPKPMNLNKQNLFFIFTLIDFRNYTVIENLDSYFDFEFRYTRCTKTKFSNVNKEKLLIENKNCSELEGSSPEYDVLTNFDKNLMKNSICNGNKLVNRTEDIILNGTFLENNFSQISIWIRKCNQTERNLKIKINKCKNEEEITNIRDNSFLELFFVNTNVDMKIIQIPRQLICLIYFGN